MATDRQKRREGIGYFSDAGRIRKRAPTAWIWTERLLFASGIALLTFCGAVRIESIVSSHAALEKFAAVKTSANTLRQPGGADTSSSQDMNSSEVSSGLWNERPVHSAEKDPREQSDAPLAVLHIPKIGLEVPVLEGTGRLTLNHAVGRIPGTARPGEAGNVGIAGHRDGFFRGVKDMGMGDTIDIELPQGTETYMVDEINIVSPNNVDVLRPRPIPSLTLVTCYPFHFIGSAPQRYIVHASRTEFVPKNTNPTEQGSLTLAKSKTGETK
jgi:sortase A